jgi:hypothetical protein
MTDLNHAEQSRGQLLGNGVGTIIAVLLAYAALDDITTDNATTFAFEWVLLGLCAAWLLLVSRRLVRSGHRWLGSASLVVLMIASAAGSRIRQGGSFEVEYLATLSGLVWFLGLGGLLVTRALRIPHHSAA